ncbi:MAG: glycosyltransferase [Chloroflexi bacterium]|nr:glycosyltransferase [Chloroflexota bacterium]
MTVINKKPRVAISQPYIILGGRLEVILGLVKALNGLGIEPDILCLALAFPPDQIEQKYGYQLRMKFRALQPRFPWKSVPQDYQILVFNSLLKRYGQDYDLFIDSSNSQIFLPSQTQVLSYVHFPREYRLFANEANIHLPNQKYTALSAGNLSRQLLRFIYRAAKPQPAREVVCNSIFTHNAFQKIYPAFSNEAPIIYPPVRLSQYLSRPAPREKSIVSLGRFAEDKGQLDVIKLAEKLPEIEFHVMGFVLKPDYYELCQRYISEHQLRNVHLHPNIDFDALVSILKTSKYFLHTLINEPFGLSTVQAIAAGCLPLVHDSGGQKETVPIDGLRYQCLDEIPRIIRQFEAMPGYEIESLVAELQKKALHDFDESVFQDKITCLLKHILNLD